MADGVLMSVDDRGAYAAANAHALVNSDALKPTAVVGPHWTSVRSGRPFSTT
jgi:hypothetical protein